MSIDDSNIANQLNAPQQEAVNHRLGPLMVVAGPGSGKTRVIAARTAAMIAEGIDPYRLLVITFTRAAAQEMRQRIGSLPGVGPQRLQRLAVTTFHSLFYRLLSRFQAQPRLATGLQQRRWVEQSLRAHGEDPKEDLVSELLGAISYAKNNLQTVKDLQDNGLLHQVWPDYEAMKSESGQVDYDDLLLLTHQLLLAKPAVCRELQERWTHIMVDEFQDTSLAQYEIIRLLAAPQNNLCVVGDVDQAIYEWRAASPDYLLRFEEHYPTAKRVVLNFNYRSTPPIIAAANRVIGHNTMRHAISMSAVRGGGIPPAHLTPVNELAEAKAVLTMIKGRQQEGLPLEEMAVLYRINNQAQHLIDLLVEEGIPFVVRDQGASFYDQWVVRDLLAFLRLVEEPEHVESLLAVGRRQLGLNDATAERVLRESSRFQSPWAVLMQFDPSEGWRAKVDKLRQDLAASRGIKPAEVVDRYLNEMGYASYLRWVARRRGVEEDSFISICQELQVRMSEYQSLDQFLRHIDRVQSVVKGAHADQTQTGALNLMTLHTAKGLEFRAVWILGVIEGLLPHHLASGPRQIEEERRLFYVGCTRAKDYLCLLSPSSYRFMDATVSPFVAEATGKSITPTRLTTGVAVPKPGMKRPAARRQSPAEEGSRRQGSSLADAPKRGVIITHAKFGQGKVVGSRRIEASEGYHQVEVDFGGEHKLLHWETCLALNLVSLA